jgi:hypothetical protein
LSPNEVTLPSSTVRSWPTVPTTSTNGDVYWLGKKVRTVTCVRAAP